MKKNTATLWNNVMLSRHYIFPGADAILLTAFCASRHGVLSCLDKVRFRGAIRWLAKPAGMMQFLWKVQVLLKDFPALAKDTTATLRTAVEQAAIEQGRPVEYLTSNIDKDAESVVERRRGAAGSGELGKVLAPWLP